MRLTEELPSPLLASASRRRVGSIRLSEPNGEWNLPYQLLGETPNRATGSRFGIGTLLFSYCIEHA